MLKTFSIQTLGCRVNQYESDQLATLLRARGLREVASGGDLRVINTCTVTVQAASKSRQTVRRSVRLPVLHKAHGLQSVGVFPDSTHPIRPRVLVTGCWATSNPDEASNLPGVDAVLGHHDDVASELDRLLALWMEDQTTIPLTNHAAEPQLISPPAESVWDDGSMIQAGTPQRLSTNHHTHVNPGFVKQKVDEDSSKAHNLGIDHFSPAARGRSSRVASDPAKRRVAKGRVLGTRSLPQLTDRQSHHQRAFLKIQDGCDAHCTYCIIPQLRPTLWSKPVEACVEEARALVDAGHREIVLTGIFLGAYGQPTALRRRQAGRTAKPLADLVEALCTQVPHLHRLRFSSLEPGDLTEGLIERLRSHQQIVPHFHLPLQSGSDALLHRMNRQYTRDDFLRMLDRVYGAFDRPAITTDIIVGFPGETDDEFAGTLDIVDRARFIHIHAFSFSPRPSTAAARWQDDFVRGPVVNERINLLNERSKDHSFEFRQGFLGEIVEILTERLDARDDSRIVHGRCPRYFDVHVEHLAAPLAERVRAPGTALNVRISRVMREHTFGEVVE